MAGMRNPRAAGAVSELAELVLPWLPPADLAAAASASRAMRAAASAVTARRAADFSRGLEAVPVPFDNPIDSKPYAYFLYTPFSLIHPAASASAHAQPWGCAQARPPCPTWPRPDLGLPSAGCACAEADCGAAGCPCADAEAEMAAAEMGTLRECGDGCACGPSCANRRTQRGVTARLRVVRQLKKGWGLHAAEVLRRAQFVCEYAGEFLTTEETRRRQRLYDELASAGKLSPALLVIREHLPSGRSCMRVNIDATKVGNVARFINHSCDGGNLQPVLVRSSGALLPRLCFFAARDIAEGEEITFSYGDARLKTKGLPCFCGSSCCPGVLPAEET
ncbi:histone-lysine N-methyltransferase SUVR3 [Lolium rigidum]|uniref:histone-lysine N-methyltransferase SUVR3 n=1 Tax=Lolium rigidum TaxID=89674 RepID=UPI001F5D5AFA|nr:histone-lysine N-methyltransferase SUVR3 [Lolium rigidum]